LLEAEIYTVKYLAMRVATIAVQIDWQS
jgi:hypothetical protein